MTTNAPDQSTPATRLRLAREKAGFKSAAEVIERFGWKQSTYLAHENGQNGIRADKAAVYADAFKVTVGWLLTGETAVPVAPTYHPAASVVGIGDFPSSLIEVKGKEFASIPVYDVRFSAGFGAQNDDELPLDYHEISMSTLRRFTDAPLNKLVFLRVSGDSMEPLLYNRDWVLIDARRTNLVSPAIYAIVFEGEGFLKHASRNLETGAVTLASQNPLYPPQTIVQPEGLRIIGRVVLSLHMH